MKIGKKMMLFATVFAVANSLSLYGGNVRKIHFVEDDGQSYMVSKIYELKYVKAVDVTPFVLGAVKRYTPNSKVSRLNYKFKKQQYLLVTTARQMMPYVDDLVKKLDHPGAVKDEWGSTISGTGISQFSYSPRYRSTEDMINILRHGAVSHDGDVFRDPVSNMIYWKDSASDGKKVLTWVKNLDRPVPQVELTVKLYSVRDSDLRDLGIDYLAWKNGPGLEIFGIGFNTLNFRSSEKIVSTVLQKFADLSSNMSYAFGGFYTAPQFDASFIRCLEQSGNAKIIATSYLTVSNDYHGKYSIKFTPEYQNITKDSSNDKSNVVTGRNAGLFMEISQPIICFEKFAPHGPKGKKYGTIDYDRKSYVNGDGNITFRYNIASNNIVERDNYGEELIDHSQISSSLTLHLKCEKLLASWTKNSDVKQVIGVPYLCKIPVLKYLFSTTTTIKEKNYLFVTVKGRLLHPKASLSEFAGKVIAASEMSPKKSNLRHK